MPIDPRILSYRYLVKTIKFRSGQDFWNSFLASITKMVGEGIPEDPLAHLHVRSGPRKSDIRSTYGMISQEDGSLTWEIREFVENPDPAERTRHPRVHKTPMYPKAIKAHYSKPLSTTYINLSQNIRPSLFGLPGEVSCGVMLPLNSQYVLINRLFKTDGWSYRRPYDSGAATPQMAASFEELDRLAQLKGPGKNFSEVLARLKWVHEDRASQPFCLHHY